MPLPVIQPAKSHFLNLAASEVEAILKGWNWPRFRGDQLINWVYEKLIDDPAKMTTFNSPIVLFFISISTSPPPRSRPIKPAAMIRRNCC